MLNRYSMEKSFINRAKPIAPADKMHNKVFKWTKNPINQFLLMGVVLVALQFISLQIPGLMLSTYISVIGNIMVYSIMSVGFCLLLGYSGLASLGTAGFVGVGAYVAYFIMQEAGMSYILTFIVAIIVSIILGVSIGFISLRIEGIYLAIITLGLSEVLRYVLKAIYSGTVQIKNSNLKLFGIHIGSDGMYYIVAVVFIALLIVTSHLINSPTGRAMLAMKNSTSASQAYGISLMKFRLLAFIIATIYATIAGMSYLLVGNALSPSSEAETMLKLTLSLNVLAAVIIGGYRSIWGTLLGVVFVFGLQSLLPLLLPYSVYSVLSPYLSTLIGVLMIVVVMFFPGGIAQLVISCRYKIQVARAKRRLYKYGTEE